MNSIRHYTDATHLPILPRSKNEKPPAYDSNDWNKNTVNNGRSHAVARRTISGSKAETERCAEIGPGHVERFELEGGGTLPASHARLISTTETVIERSTQFLELPCQLTWNDALGQAVQLPVVEKSKINSPSPCGDEVPSATSWLHSTCNPNENASETFSIRDLKPDDEDSLRPQALRARDQPEPILREKAHNHRRWQHHTDTKSSYAGTASFGEKAPCSSLVTLIADNVARILGRRKPLDSTKRFNTHTERDNKGVNKIKAKPHDLSQAEPSRAQHLEGPDTYQSKILTKKVAATPDSLRGQLIDQPNSKRAIDHRIVNRHAHAARPKTLPPIPPLITSPADEADKMLARDHHQQRQHCSEATRNAKKVKQSDHDHSVDGCACGSDQCVAPLKAEPPSNWWKPFHELSTESDISSPISASDQSNRVSPERAGSIDVFPCPDSKEPGRCGSSVPERDDTRRGDDHCSQLATKEVADMENAVSNDQDHRSRKENSPPVKDHSRPLEQRHHLRVSTAPNILIGTPTRSPCRKRVPSLSYSVDSPLDVDVTTPDNTQAVVRVETDATAMTQDTISIGTISPMQRPDLELSQPALKAILLGAEEVLQPKIFARFWELITVKNLEKVQLFFTTLNSGPVCNVLGATSSGTPPTAGNASAAQSRRSDRTNTQQVKRRKAHDEDEDEEEGGGKRRDKRRSYNGSTDKSLSFNGGLKKLACPFHKRNPQKYCDLLASKRRYKVCPRGFADPKDLQGHLKGVHGGPKLVCGRCSMQFQSPVAMEKHVKQAIPCEFFEDPEFAEEGYIMSEDRRRATKKKSKLDTVEEHWFKIWSILFPGIPKPLSIYENLTEIVAAYDQAVEELVPQYIRAVLAPYFGTSGVDENATETRRLCQEVRDRAWELAGRTHLSNNRGERVSNDNNRILTSHTSYMGPQSSPSDQEAGEMVTLSSSNSSGHPDNHGSFGFAAHHDGNAMFMYDTSGNNDNRFPTGYTSRFEAPLAVHTSGFSNIMGSANDFLGSQMTTTQATTSAITANVRSSYNTASYPIPRLSRGSSGTAMSNADQVPHLEPIITEFQDDLNPSHPHIHSMPSGTITSSSSSSLGPAGFAQFPPPKMTYSAQPWTPYIIEEGIMF